MEGKSMAIKIKFSLENKMRAQWALETLQRSIYVDDQGDEINDEIIIDLMTDLLHLAKSLKMDTASILRMVEMNFMEEH
jgi:phenylalanine-4-hydroxylase